MKTKIILFLAALSFQFLAIKLQLALSARPEPPRKPNLLT